jgi:hypothetical protein
MNVMPGLLSYADVGFLPVVAGFVKKIGVPKSATCSSGDRFLDPADPYEG